MLLGARSQEEGGQLVLLSWMAAHGPEARTAAMLSAGKVDQVLVAPELPAAGQVGEQLLSWGK